MNLLKVAPRPLQLSSTQVLQEFCVRLRRKADRPLQAEEIRRLVQD